MSVFQLAVSAEMVFTDLPFIERVRRIDDLGFAGRDLELGRQEPGGVARHGSHFHLDDRVPAR
jgi:hydroxypyruvate isomerase